MLTLERERINHFLLRKHHLTPESLGDTIVRIAVGLVGLHATGATTPYLSLFARMRTFSKGDLERELGEKRSLGRIRCMRGTMFLQPISLLPMVSAATRGLWVDRTKEYMRRLGVSEEEYAATSEAILDVLTGQGLETRAIKKALGSDLNVSAIINCMCDEGVLIRGPSNKGWKSSIHTYYRFEEFFPNIDLDSINEQDARLELITRYIKSYGPVTVNDISWWAGFTKMQTKTITAQIEDELSSIQINSMDGHYLIFNSDLKALQELTVPTEPVITLLPELDPYMMGYKDRERYIPSDYFNNIFDRSGNATATILKNGEVIGVWDYVSVDKKTPAIKFLLFEPVRDPVMNEILQVAERTGTFIFDREVEIIECQEMTPLPERTAGGFMTPLKDSPY